jgi:dehydrogenase/reductase SDR family protein 1
MITLTGQVALVTGATRGVGRGVALGLAHAGATVFATGRTIGQVASDPQIKTIRCDHSDDRAVAEVFRTIDLEAGPLDILVNVAWGGYERMVEDAGSPGRTRSGANRAGDGTP